MVKLVQAYETADGRLYKTEETARRATLKLIASDKMKELLREPPCTGGSQLTAFELLYFMENPKLRSLMFDYLEALEDWHHA